MNETILSKQEKNWLLERRVTRLADNKEVQIYPMGAERYLSASLFGTQKSSYNIQSDIAGKNILVIPGYGNSGFLFAQAQAQSVTVYDKDPVTLAWIKAFKKYYHYREGSAYPSIGELLTALTKWYPPIIALPFGNYRNRLFWALHPNLLRRVYIHYMLSLVAHALQAKSGDNCELDKNIQFYTGTINKVFMDKKHPEFDTAFVPYLLGVRNGIEQTADIVPFIQKLLTIVPKGHILVTPTNNKKEFYIVGKSYFITPGYSNMLDIPELQQYLIDEDRKWFRTQGLTVFGAH